MSEVIRLINNFFYNIPALFKSFFWKRDEQIVLMDSWFGNKFADNPRFLFQYLSDNKEKLGLTHVIWVTRNESVNEELNNLGYESYMINSKESIYYHKHAKYHIVNNSPNNNDEFTGELLEGYSFGAIRINLWHGIAGKGVKFANTAKVSKYSRNKLFSLYLKLNKLRFWRLLFDQKCGWGDAYYLAQSTEGKRVLETFFRLPDKNYILTGYPRICNCSSFLTDEQMVIDKINDFSKTVLYLPTFRSNTNFNFQNLADEISDVLDEQDILWIQKAHSADVQNEFDSKNFSTKNVLNLNPNFDINTLLPYVDVLITDYSSCMIEGIGLHKKLIFYVPDFDEYLSHDRGVSYNPDIAMCGPKAYNIGELKKLLVSIDSIDVSTKQYRTAFELYWSETGEKTLDEIWYDIKEQTR